MLAGVLVPLLLGVLVLVGGLAAIALLWWLFRYLRAQEKTRRERWRRLALQTGLTTNADCTTLSGENGPLSVTLKRTTQTTMAGSTPVVTNYHQLTITGLPHDIRLGGEGVLSGLLRGPDHELGDPGFDEVVRLDGSRDRLLAELGPRNRSLARTVAAAGGAIDGGRLTLRSGELPEEETRAALALAASLARREEPHVRLPRTVRSETHPGIRQAQLARALDMDGVDREALAQEALQWDPGCRLLAARFLGDTDAIRDVATDPEAPAAVRVSAATRLGEPDLQPVLLDALREDLDTASLHDAIQGLHQWGTIAAVEPLMNQGRGGPVPDATRKRARAAIHAIQERAGVSGANLGALSVTEHVPEAGNLTVAMVGGELTTAETGDSDLETQAIKEDPSRDECTPARLPRGDLDETTEEPTPPRQTQSQ